MGRAGALYVGVVFCQDSAVSNAVYYAIGDVHGEARRLAYLYELILAEIDADRIEACIVHLGDLIDRGARSRDCIALAMTLHACASGALRVVTLRGNHEQMLLDAVEEPESGAALQYWRRNGGDAALASYCDVNGWDRQNWRASVDQDHIAFLKTLPNLAVDEERRIAFVHAGIDPQTYPDCRDDVRLWTRSPRFFSVDKWPDRGELEGLVVVHGHTPTPDLAPQIVGPRINVDTGAVYGGPLTAAVLAPRQPVRFLQV